MSPLTSAQGYFELKLYEDAWQEIDALPVDVRDSRPAYELRLNILLATERWEKCQWLAEGLAVTAPDWPCLYLTGAKAFEKLGNMDGALALLMRGVDG